MRHIPSFYLLPAINLADSSCSIIWDSTARAAILTATGTTEFAKRTSIAHGDQTESIFDFRFWIFDFRLEELSILDFRLEELVME